MADKASTASTASTILVTAASAWVVLYIVVLYFMQVNVFNLRLYWQYLLIQAVSWIALGVLMVVSAAMHPHRPFPLFLAVFMGCFLVLILIRVYTIIHSYRDTDPNNSKQEAEAAISIQRQSQTQASSVNSEAAPPPAYAHMNPHLDHAQAFQALALPGSLSSYNSGVWGEVDQNMQATSSFKVREAEGPDRNLSGPFMRWDMMMSTVIMTLVLYHVYYDVIAVHPFPGRHALFLAMLFFVYPIIVFLPYLKEVPTPDRSVAVKAAALSDWIWFVRTAEVAQEALVSPSKENIENTRPLPLKLALPRNYRYAMYQEIFAPSWVLKDVYVEPEMDITVAFMEDTETRDFVILFSSTRSKRNVRTDLNVRLSTLPEEWKVPVEAQVHRGFLQAYLTVDAWILKRLAAWSKDGTLERMHRFFVCGYSLGGALATLATARIIAANTIPPSKLYLYTYGGPHVGDGLFVDWLDNALSNNHLVRFVNPRDPVPAAMRSQLVHTKGYYPVAVPLRGNLPHYTHDIEVYRLGIQRGLTWSIASILAPTVITMAILTWVMLFVLPKTKAMKL